jgi:chromosome segregation ATPase
MSDLLGETYDDGERGVKVGKRVIRGAAVRQNALAEKIVSLEDELAACKTKYDDCFEQLGVKLLTELVDRYDSRLETWQQERADVASELATVTKERDALKNNLADIRKKNYGIVLGFVDNLVNLVHRLRAEKQRLIERLDDGSKQLRAELEVEHTADREIIETCRRVQEENDRLTLENIRLDKEWKKTHDWNNELVTEHYQLRAELERRTLKQQAFSGLLEACKLCEGMLAIWSLDPSKSRNTILSTLMPALNKVIAEASPIEMPAEDK